MPIPTIFPVKIDWGILRDGSLVFQSLDSLTAVNRIETLTAADQVSIFELVQTSHYASKPVGAEVILNLGEILILTTQALLAIPPTDLQSHAVIPPALEAVTHDLVTILAQLSAPAQPSAAETVQ